MPATSESGSTFVYQTVSPIALSAARSDTVVVIASQIFKVGDVCCTDPADAVHPRTVAARCPHKWLSEGVCTFHAIITILAERARCDSEEVILQSTGHVVWPLIQ